jgi:pyruvate kinase
MKPELTDLEEVFKLAAEVALEVGIAKNGDLLVTTAGIPLRVPGSTTWLGFKESTWRY